MGAVSVAMAVNLANVGLIGGLWLRARTLSYATPDCGRPHGSGQGTISPPCSPLRCASRVACAITSRAPGLRPPCWFNWLMKGLSKHADCWIIVLVRRE